MKRLSSKLTVLYKCVIPSFFLLIVMICGIGVIINFEDTERVMPFALNFFGFLLLLFLCVPLFKLNDIYYNEDFTIVINKGKMKRYKNSEIKLVKRYLFYFFRIEFKDPTTKKILFFPHISEVFFGFKFVPKSIKKYRSFL